MSSLLEANGFGLADWAGHSALDRLEEGPNSYLGARSAQSAMIKLTQPEKDPINTSAESEDYDEPEASSLVGIDRDGCHPTPTFASSGSSAPTT